MPRKKLHSAIAGSIKAGLPEKDEEKGRLTKYSAKGMLAKLYLYNKDYDNAKLKAKEVMESGQYDLFPDYGAMFNSSSNNNNVESLFSVQHQLTSNPWGSGNQKNPDRGPGNLQTDEASMWELYIPTMDIKNAYEFGDTRRAGSMMEHGWSKPAWKPQNTDPDYNAFMASGYKYDTTVAVGKGGQRSMTLSNIAKYVVGPGAKYGGETVLGMNTGINTMMLRYADVLLVYAEAVLGNNASTADGEALAAFNKVRARANLSPKTTITADDVLKERRVEFAFEGEYWFDIQRQGFTKAKQIIESQNRGSAETAFSVHNFTEKMMYLPIPANEVLQDPALAEEPVPYY